MTEREVMDANDAADFLGLSAPTVRRYAKQGIIPGKKVGKEWRFVKANLLDWLKGTESLAREG